MVSQCSGVMSSGGQGRIKAWLLLLSHRETEAVGLLIPEGGPSIPAQDTHSEALHSCSSPRPSSAFLPLPPVSLTSLPLSQTSSCISIFLSFVMLISPRQDKKSLHKEQTAHPNRPWGTSMHIKKPKQQLLTLRFHSSLFTSPQWQKQDCMWNFIYIKKEEMYKSTTI